jgi:hypothetical protein
LSDRVIERNGSPNFVNRGRIADCGLGCNEL